jgi:hypothetical protein
MFRYLNSCSREKEHRLSMGWEVAATTVWQRTAKLWRLEEEWSRELTRGARR